MTMRIILGQVRRWYLVVIGKGKGLRSSLLEVKDITRRLWGHLRWFSEGECGSTSRNPLEDFFVWISDRKGDVQQKTCVAGQWSRRRLRMNA